MQIEIKIDSSCKEPRIVVWTDQMTEEVSCIIKKLSEEQPHLLAGFHEGKLELLNQMDIIRIYTSDGKVYAEKGEESYGLRLRLYELEERLDKKTFVRISSSEIINLQRVKEFDLSFSGTICVTLRNGSVTYVSRRYVKRIKQMLGI